MHQHADHWAIACNALVAGNLFTVPTTEQADDATIEAASPQPIATTTPPAPPAPVPQIEPEPTDRNYIFRAQRAMREKVDELVFQQQQLEAKLVGKSFTEGVDWKCQSKTAAAVIQHLVYFAQGQYAPAGGALSIDTHKMREAVGIVEWETRFHEGQHGRRGKTAEVLVDDLIDLDKVVTYLADTYGGDAGLKQAYSQAAEMIIKLFSLQKDDAISRTKSGVVLLSRTWSRMATYGSNEGKYEPNISQGDASYAQIKALATFLGQCDLNVVRPHQLMNADFLKYHFGFKPREKRTFEGLEVTFFKERWSWRFSHQLAEQLMFFLGEYGQAQ